MVQKTRGVVLPKAPALPLPLLQNGLLLLDLPSARLPQGRHFAARSRGPVTTLPLLLPLCLLSPLLLLLLSGTKTQQRLQSRLLKRLLLLLLLLLSCQQQRHDAGVEGGQGAQVRGDVQELQCGGGGLGERRIVEDPRGAAGTRDGAPGSGQHLELQLQGRGIWVNPE